ncbi:MAG: sulfur carrier protein ThiS [Deltaproteobacteria bacterium]|nr:sulfur carrier protein ThiS [Deltaproteobacteria bacterium]
MEVTINGKKQQIEQESLNIKELLLHSEVNMIDMVSVQQNGQFVNKDDFESTLVKKNDSIDFLFFMGGGDR